MKSLRKDKVSAVFRVIRPKLCGKCVFPQNVYTRKLGEITAFLCSVFYHKKDSSFMFIINIHHIFTKSSILDVWLDPKYTSVIFITELYLGPFQIYMMGRFAKIANCQKPFSIFTKCTILDVWQEPKYTSVICSTVVYLEYI